MSSVTSDRINGLTTSAARKAPVTCATTANITLSGEQTIDGVTTSESRVLVKDQTDTTENGIYESSSGAWTRVKDFDGSRDVVTGTDVFVTSGTDNGGEYWYVSTTGDPDPGDAMVFTQATLNAPAAGTLTAANNLSDVASASTAFSNIKQAATTSASGVVELATTAEADAGTSTTLAVTPAGVASAIAASGTFTVNGLTAITTLQGTDQVAVADNSDSDNNKKITWANFKTQIVADLLKDEDDMASDSASHGTTQQAVKAYVDANILKEGTEQTATGVETAFDYESIPTGTKRIIISFYGVELSGTDELLIQIGDSGGIETTGYNSQSGVMRQATTPSIDSSTAGFILSSNNVMNNASGHMILTRVDSSGLKWVSSHSAYPDDGTSRTATGGGRKTLSAELDRVRVTRDGTDTFSSGSLNIEYE